MRWLSLQDLLKKDPSLPVSLRSIPGVPARVRRVFGKTARPTWGTDLGAVTQLAYLAGLADGLAALSERVAALESALREFHDKAELARAAEQAWTVKAALRGEVTFCNSAGRVAHASLEFLQAFAARQQLDASKVVEDSDEVVVMDGDSELERMPKSLWITLDRVLSQAPWLFCDA